MEEENQLPLKRVELSLSKFNDVAIPHHLELLRQHKANIIKYEEAGQYGWVRGEQTGAGRAAARLRALLAELAALRARVREPDRAAFDARTQRSRDLTLQAVMDYLGLIERGCSGLATPRRGRESSPVSMQRGAEPGRDAAAAAAGSAASTDSVGVVAHARARGRGGDGGRERDGDRGSERDGDRGSERDDCDVPLVQLQIDDRELALAERSAALRGWTELQGELHALHAAWAATHAAARAQRHALLGATERVHVAADHVRAARTHLSAAERLKAGAWGAGGAAAGALLGGPLGLVLGAKAGAAAMFAGSLLGYCGARLLGHHRRRQLAIQDQPASEEPPEEEKKTQ